jgi:DNA-binding response OmpR family regulator
MADEHTAVWSAEHRPRVLIVDDDGEMRAVLRDALQRNGYLVREHSTGDGLIPLLESWTADAVVLDNIMEGATGLELLSCIRQCHPGTPVVLVTAFGGAETESEALRLGATYYMDKPFRVARLLDVLQAAVAQAGDRRGREFAPIEIAHGSGHVLAQERTTREPADPRALAREIVTAARAAGGLALFVRFEHTLCAELPERRPGRLPLLVRGALVALAGAPFTRVVVVSAQDARDLETQINVPGIIYAGCRGLQIRSPGGNVCHPAAVRLRDRLPALAQELAERLAGLSGVDIELKELGLTVHARRGDESALAAIAAAAGELSRTTGNFRAWVSDSAVDLFPDVNGPRRPSALWTVDEWTQMGQPRPTVVYLGEPDASEPLEGVEYAIRVGSPTGAAAPIRWVPDRAAAADLLAQIAFSWSARPSSW